MNLNLKVLLNEVVIEPNVKLECVPKFCYMGDTLGAGGGVEEAAKARERFARALSSAIVSYPNSLDCIIPHKGKDIQGLCPECIDIWD